MLCLTVSMAWIAVPAMTSWRGISDAEVPLLSRVESFVVADPAASSLFLAAAGALLGGCLAGLVGLGGGMVLGPLLLELGVHPLVCCSCQSACGQCRLQCCWASSHGVHGALTADETIYRMSEVTSVPLDIFLISSHMMLISNLGIEFDPWMQLQPSNLGKQAAEQSLAQPVPFLAELDRFWSCQHVLFTFG